MRKSQAPSLKTKFFSPVVKQVESLNNSPAFNPECCSKVIRSTESVLELLSSSNDIFVTQNEESVTDLCLSEKSVCQKSTISESVNGINHKENEKSDSPVTVFNVVYGKQTKKKHKTWEGDGILEITSKYLTLKDENGKVMGTLPCTKARKLETGERFYIGSKEIELIDLINEKSSATEEKNVNISSVNSETKTLDKIKSKKRFLKPSFVYSSGLALPQPNAQHQWHFNERALPVTPVYIEGHLSNKLRDHQRDGIIFLYECVMGFKEINMTGAILADEMGLGKTLQCIALIWTLLKQGPYGNEPVVKKVLIVTPSSLTMNWHNEFIKWLGRARILPYVVNQKNKPSKMLGPVMIISYEMLVRCLEDIEKLSFDLLICDEGHRLKNCNIKTTQILSHLNCSKRILLTGTPIQNDLQEFYALVDFVNPNSLGNPVEFRRKFEEPILAYRQPNADEDIIAKGKECLLELKRITSRFMLRRTRDILNNYLPPRQELVVFCKITDIQKKIYDSIIDSLLAVKENILGLSDGSAHLEVIMSLRKVCNHPCLFHGKSQNENFNNLSFKDGKYPVVEVSSKVTVTINFLKELQATSPKEKVVIVSHSTQTLDVLGEFLKSVGYSTCRLDGSTPAAQRNGIVERFNLSYCKSFVFLLSAKAGGVGLNLTGASRLILFDSDWNPATDLQAIARIWRDGQKYPVYIYRLLTSGTIEEKIYQRQISKQGLCEGTIDPENAKSIKLSNEELKDIFSPCSLTEDCLTHDALSCECSKQGEIPVSELELEERSCQLVKQTNSVLKISELFNWEHHGIPFHSELLSQWCLKSSEREISFIFRCCKN